MVEECPAWELAPYWLAGDGRHPRRANRCFPGLPPMLRTPQQNSIFNL